MQNEKERKGRKWAAKEVMPNCFEIYNKEENRLVGRIVKKEGEWQILGFIGGIYKKFDQAARRTLDYDVWSLVEYHTFVEKCPSCGENHLPVPAAGSLKPTVKKDGFGNGYMRLKVNDQ